MELIKDYDCEIRYHPGRTNDVTDALSRKSQSGSSCVKSFRLEIVSDLIKRLNVAQKEALKDENLKGEVMVKTKERLEVDSRGLKVF